MDFVLNEIFELKHFLGVNLNHPKNMLNSLIDLFHQFSVSSLKNGGLAYISYVDELIGSILVNSKQSKEELSKEGFFVRWFPDYGCVLIAVQKVAQTIIWLKEFTEVIAKQNLIQAIMCGKYFLEIIAKVK